MSAALNQSLSRCCEGKVSKKERAFVFHKEQQRTGPLAHWVALTRHDQTWNVFDDTLKSPITVDVVESLPPHQAQLWLTFDLRSKFIRLDLATIGQIGDSAMRWGSNRDMGLSRALILTIPDQIHPVQSLPAVFCWLPNSRPLLFRAAAEMLRSECQLGHQRRWAGKIRWYDYHLVIEHQTWRWRVNHL